MKSSPSWCCAAVVTLALAVTLPGCGQQPAPSSAPGTRTAEKKDPGANRKPPDPKEDTGGDRQPSPKVDLAAARKQFTTKLRKRGPAPQPFQKEVPPPGVKEVLYQSGDLKLKGWLSADPGDGKRRPAVVFLHGGWSFDLGDWHDAEPFIKAGFVLFMPMLRAENGNPGIYESFYGEVDDAVAAGKFVAALPYVDSDRVFVAGHSVGAVLTVLTAMVPSPYREAAALSGYVDMKNWAALSPAQQVPYDPADREEIRLRDPMAFVASLRIPLTLYVEPPMRTVNEPLATQARQAGKVCALEVVPGNHQTMVAPAVQRAIARFNKHKPAAP
jgi:acetyl esterase/lipase